MLKQDVGERKQESKGLARCVGQAVEDEAHFLLHCYVFERQSKIQSGFNFERIRGDDEWLMDALLGHGLRKKEARMYVFKSVANTLPVRLHGGRSC